MLASNRREAGGVPSESPEKRPVPARRRDHDSAGADADPLPPRLKAYKPLSEAQKKKIAKRAGKIDRSSEIRGANPRNELSSPRAALP